MLNSPNNSAHGEIRSSPPGSIAELKDGTELGFEMTDALFAVIDWYQDLDLRAATGRPIGR